MGFSGEITGIKRETPDGLDVFESRIKGGGWQLHGKHDE